MQIWMLHCQLHFLQTQGLSPFECRYPLCFLMSSHFLQHCFLVSVAAPSPHPTPPSPLALLHSPLYPTPLTEAKLHTQPSSHSLPLHHISLQIASWSGSPLHSSQVASEPCSSDEKQHRRMNDGPPFIPFFPSIPRSFFTVSLQIASRTGSPLRSSQLASVSAASARTIILLAPPAPSPADADAYVSDAWHTGMVAPPQAYL